MMGKLITPVQHELVLDGLNEIRPLQLQDEVKRVVSLPVVNANPANKSNIARGKFLRCDNGAMLATNKVYYNNYQEKQWDEDDTDSRYYTVLWNPPVKLVQIEIVLRIPPSSISFYNSTYTTVLKNCNAVGMYYYPFVGDTQYLKTIAIGTGHIAFYLYGFY